jgi:hypothetical protein
MHLLMEFLVDNGQRSVTFDSCQKWLVTFGKHWRQISANSGGDCGLAGSGGSLWWQCLFT